MSSASSRVSASSAGSAETACTIDVHNSGDTHGYARYGAKRIRAWLESVHAGAAPHVKVQPHGEAEDKAEQVREELLGRLRFSDLALDRHRVSVSPSAAMPESPMTASEFQDASQQEQLHDERDLHVSVERCRRKDRLLVFKKYFRKTMPTHQSLDDQLVYELSLYYKDLKGLSNVVQIQGHFYDSLGTMTLVFPDLGTNQYPRDRHGILSYMRQMLVALDALWRRQIVHCNIKGGSRPNAIFDSRGKLALIDFESAVRRHELIDQGQEGSSLQYWGSPHYAAPEVLFPQPGRSPYGATRFGRRRDVFSAGLVFAELILKKHHLIGGRVAEYARLRTRLESMHPVAALTSYGEFRLGECIEDDEFNELAADLVVKMLTWCRGSRPSPKELLQHSLFHPRPVNSGSDSE